jgi:hypothetical protein
MAVSLELRKAAERGDTAAIQGWLSSGTRDLDEKDAHGLTLLYWAAHNGRCDTMRFLLDRGASVNVTGDFGRTALSGAAWHRQHDAAVLLLDRGAQIDLPDDYGSTPLIKATDGGHFAMVRLLLRRGAALAPRTDDGRDAEAWARRNGNDEAAALLADFRLAGGTWDAYLRYPRKRLLALRVLCERGRASTGDDLLKRVFGPNVPAPQGIDPAFFKQLSADERDAAIGMSLRVYPSQPLAKMPRSIAHVQLPKEIFWLILKFWRSGRDSDN